MFLTENANKIIGILTENGYRAYAVGGCVRDFLLNVPCGDIDIAASSLPDKTETLLKKAGIKVIETGLKHGTVTALIDGESYEITTFRKDGDYKDSRRPDSVEFVSEIESDLGRRDFTVNAMAYNNTDGIIDLFGGKEDLKNGIIRAVGEPGERFKEDALRIMRALRFASVLGFEIEEITKKALFENAKLLCNISYERIFAELTKLLTGKNAVKVLLEYRKIIGVVIPELIPCFDCAQNNPWHIYNVYEHIARSVGAVRADAELRLTMLLHDIGKPIVKTTDENGVDHFKFHAAVGADIAEKILKRFKVSNELRDKVTALIRFHQSVENVDEIRIKRWLSKIGVEYTRALLEVRTADLKAHNPAKTGYELKRMEEIKQELEAALNAGDAFRISDLAVNGNDLIALGYHGEKIGEKLKKILRLVVDDKLKNEREEILDFLKKEK